MNFKNNNNTQNTSGSYAYVNSGPLVVEAVSVCIRRRLKMRVCMGVCVCVYKIHTCGTFVVVCICTIMILFRLLRTIQWSVKRLVVAWAVVLCSSEMMINRLVWKLDLNQVTCLSLLQFSLLQ